MGLFANRWRTLREAASSEVASSAVQEPEQAPEPEPVRRRRIGKLRNIELQQNELRT